MRILVCGSKGMLGTDLVRLLEPRHNVIGVDFDEMDITCRNTVCDQISAMPLDLVINTAAYTDVDGSEQKEAEAFLVNADGPENLAFACRDKKIPLIHVSTDYVFDGLKKTPYYTDDQPNPIGVYGRSKLEGERRIQNLLSEVCIVRTAWLYGKAGKNFVKAILAQASKKNLLKVVSDQRGGPTFTMDLALALQAVAEKGLRGIYHVTNKGSCSWLEFAERILVLSGKDGVEIEPISTSELKRPAPRPANSVLDCSKFEADSGMLLRQWPDALQDYMLK